MDIEYSDCSTPDRRDAKLRAIGPGIARHYEDVHRWMRLRAARHEYPEKRVTLIKQLMAGAAEAARQGELGESRKLRDAAQKLCRL